MNIIQQTSLIKALIAKVEKLDAEFIKNATERPSDIDPQIRIIRKRQKALKLISTITSFDVE